MWDGQKVQRRVPSCLDVAFAALGNDHVVPLLETRMLNPGRKFRDGLNYQHNLAAVRRIIDAQDAKAWEDSLYMHWLATLRELSKPTTDARYPEVMRTRAWAMKSLNTQLASWTHLRHDTILYVKQSYTAGLMCEYPAGLVEPIPHFWERFEKMAARAAELIDKTPYPDRQVTKATTDTQNRKVAQTYNLRELQKQHGQFFRTFAKQVGLLKAIAAKELEQKPLTEDETKVLQSVVQIHRGSGSTMYNGWYPSLFYRSREDCGRWDAVVADVHTDVPAPLIHDPGCVLTQGVGAVDLILVAVENGRDRMVFAGPLLSHYEFEMPGMTRKSDSEWKRDFHENTVPARPEWTRGYLVPGRDPKNRLQGLEPD
jgi:hypothetical protein